MFIRDNIFLSSRTSCLGYIVKSNESWFIVIFKFVIELWDICYNAVSIWHHQINHILKWNKIKMLSIFFYLGVQQTWNTKYVLSNIECKWVVEVNIVCWEIVEVYQARSEVVNNGTENETTSKGAREIHYGDVTVETTLLIQIWRAFTPLISMTRDQTIHIFVLQTHEGNSVEIICAQKKSTAQLTSLTHFCRL